jgi:hypothetical protein
MRPNYEAKESLNLQEAVRDLHARLMVLEPQSKVIGNSGQAKAPFTHPPNTVHQ